MPIVRMSNLSYEYPGSGRVLENVNLEIQEGELYFLTGPSGSGKSTLAMCIAGLLSEKTGKLTGDVKTRGKTAIVFQNPETQLVSFRVRDEMLIGLEKSGSEIINKISEHLNYVGLSGSEMRSPLEMSSGEKQKVVFASALMRNPDILILDEPTSMQDIPSRKATESIITRLKGSGKTIFYISHDIRSAKLADRMGVIESGKIIIEGPPKKVLNSSALKKVVSGPGSTHRSRKPLSGKNYIVLKNVSHSYPNGKESVKNVSFTLRKGSLTAIVGRNGSGKSTLAQLMAGVIKPSSGEVLINGKTTNSMPCREAAGKAGLVFQNPLHSLFEETVSKEVEFGPRNLGLRNPDVAAAKTIKDFNLSHLKDRDPLSLSVGQQKAVSISSVASMDSDILIVDEPDLGIDSKWSEKIMNKTLELNREGKTIVIISHNLDTILQNVPETILIRDGEVVSAGKTKDILTDSKKMAEAGLS